MSQAETRVAVIRFLKTRPEGTGAKFSELCRVLAEYSKQAIYDSLEDLTCTGIIQEDQTHLPRMWRLSTPAELPAHGFERLLKDLAQ